MGCWTIGWLMLCPVRMSCNSREGTIVKSSGSRLLKERANVINSVPSSSSMRRGRLSGKLRIVHVIPMLLLLWGGMLIIATRRLRRRPGASCIVSAISSTRRPSFRNFAFVRSRPNYYFFWGSNHIRVTAMIRRRQVLSYFRCVHITVVWSLFFRRGRGRGRGPHKALG
jgi:hypothetical protein